MSAQHPRLRDIAVSWLSNLANAHSHTYSLRPHQIYPLLFDSPLLLSDLLISSHCLPDCLSVFPCCYFRIHHQVFRSHVVSSPGKVWIMQTSLITPCAHPLDWKSMCTQVAGKWMELTHRPKTGEGERGLHLIVLPKGLTTLSVSTGTFPNTISSVWKGRRVFIHRRLNVMRTRLAKQKKVRKKIIGHRQCKGECLKTRPVSGCRTDWKRGWEFFFFTPTVSNLTVHSLLQFNHSS